MNSLTLVTLLIVGVALVAGCTNQPPANGTDNYQPSGNPASEAELAAMDRDLSQAESTNDGDWSSEVDPTTVEGMDDQYDSSDLGN